MRDTLDHLPASKQRELADVVRILFEEFDASTRMGTQRITKQARIFKIVLYGSYARGDWVDDPVGGYRSDYDILIVVNAERLVDFEYWSSSEDRLMREVMIARSLSAPVNFVVHSLTDANNQIIRGRPFFLAGWNRRSDISGRDYVSLSLAAPEFGPRRLYSNLGRVAGSDDRDLFAIIWIPAD